MNKWLMVLGFAILSQAGYASGFISLDVNNTSSHPITLIWNHGWKQVIPAHSVVKERFQENSMAAAYFMDDKKCQWFIPGVNTVALNFEERSEGGYWCRVIFRK